MGIAAVMAAVSAWGPDTLGEAATEAREEAGQSRSTSPTFMSFNMLMLIDLILIGANAAPPKYIRISDYGYGIPAYGGNGRGGGGGTQDINTFPPGQL